MRGRPPKPNVLKVLDGTHREDRHGSIDSSPNPSGLPVASEALTGRALEHWETVVPKLVSMGVATEADGEALTEMCLAWNLTRMAGDAAAVDPMDRNIRTAYLGYSKSWVTLASKFGMTPGDRTRIRVDKPTGDELEDRYG